MPGVPSSVLAPSSMCFFALQNLISALSFEPLPMHLTRFNVLLCRSPLFFPVSDIFSHIVFSSCLLLSPSCLLSLVTKDSKCSVPEATRAAVAAMTTGVTKHVVLSDSCSAACEAVNDALRHFNVLQVSKVISKVIFSNLSLFSSPFCLREKAS